MTKNEVKVFMLAKTLTKSAILLMTFIGGYAVADNPFYNNSNSASSYPRIIFQPSNEVGIQASRVSYQQASYNAFSRSGNSSTSLNPQDYPFGRPTLTCVANIAANQGVPVDLLLGIQSIERGLTGKKVGNKNTTYDIGAFQINSTHLPRIARLGGSEYDLLHRGCYNARIAAMLLSEALNQASKGRLDYYSRASGYHSWTPTYNMIYRKKLVKYTAQWQNWLRNNQLGHLISAPIPF